jgi:hypothetical protein
MGENEKELLVLRHDLVAFALLVLAGTSACSNSSSSNNGDGGGGDGGNGGCPPYQDPPGTDLTKPVVSLKSDVIPVFQGSCSLSLSCHGAATGGQGKLYLGPKAGMVDTAMLIQALMGPSVEIPSVPYVTPGDPTKSYLMQKMDGDQCLYDSHCTPDPTLMTPTCMDAGQAMPQGSTVLDVATRDKVRRWIAQGAQNN